LKVSRKISTEASSKIFVSYLKLAQIFMKNIPRKLPARLTEDNNEGFHLSLTEI